MGRAPCCEKIGLKRGRWTAEEDQLLVDYIKAHGEGGWRSLPKNAGLLRCGKSCRLRWVNYLREDLKRGNISPEEEETILKLQATLGNRWSLIAGHLPGRTDNEIKNYWNAHLSKKAAARTAAEEAGGEGEGDGDGGEPGSPSRHDRDVCSEDARSTVVNEEKDGQDDGSDDCATSCVLPKQIRKRKGKDNSHEKKKKNNKKKKKKKEYIKKEKDKFPLRTEDNTSACGDNDTCECRLKEGKRAAAAVDNDPAEEEAGKKEIKKKRKKKKPKLADQAAGAEASANVDRVGAATGYMPPVTSHTDAKAESEPDGDSSFGAACNDVEHGPVDLEPAAHVEDAVKTADGNAVLEGYGHVEDPGMGLDLLEAIDSDTGFLGLITAGSSDPHGGMLLDYLGVSGSDGACCWDGAPLGEEADSATGGWPDSLAGSAQATMFGSSEGIMSPAGGSTTSSYVDLLGAECQPSVGSPAGLAAEDGIGSLPWEAEDDTWKLLSKFVEDLEADVGDQQQEQPAQHVQQQQPQPETTQGFVSSIGSCGDDVFLDGVGDNPWLLADMFLS